MRAAGLILTISSICALIVVAVVFGRVSLHDSTSRVEQRATRHDAGPVHTSTFGRHRQALSTTVLSTINALRIQSLCTGTIYPDVCLQQLSSLWMQSAHQASPSEMVSSFLEAAVEHAEEAQKEARSRAHDCESSLNDAGQSAWDSQAATDCVELMDAVKHRLRAAIVRLQDMAVGCRNDSSCAVRDIQFWLSASLSYQTACFDGFENISANDTTIKPAGTGRTRHEIQTRQEFLSKIVGTGLSLVNNLFVLGNDWRGWYTDINYQYGAARPAPLHFDSIAEDDFESSGSDHVQGHDHNRQIVSSDHEYRARRALLDWVSDADGPQLLHVQLDDRDAVSSNSSSTTIKPNAVVAMDGSGDFVNITTALGNVPLFFEGRYVIYIKAGIYNEVFNVTSDLENITFIGDGIGRTVITGDRSVALGSFNTYRTATVGIMADGFMARDISFRNTAGPGGHQAVAVRGGGDRLVFYRCSFEGYQDTLYALAGRHYYKECVIAGTVDLIFGNAVAFFEECRLLARRPLDTQKNTYTAQGRTLALDVSGFSFYNCTLAVDSAALALIDGPAAFDTPTFLGRPWKPFSRVVFLKSRIEALIDPAGWLPWNASNPFVDTVFYGEFQNTGPGSNTSLRVDWPGVYRSMTSMEAQLFSFRSFIAGSSWIGSFGLLDSIVTV